MGRPPKPKQSAFRPIVATSHTRDGTPAFYGGISRTSPHASNEKRPRGRDVRKGVDLGYDELGGGEFSRRRSPPLVRARRPPLVAGRIPRRTSRRVQATVTALARADAGAGGRLPARRPERPGPMLVLSRQRMHLRRQAFDLAVRSGRGRRRTAESSATGVELEGAVLRLGPRGPRRPACRPLGIGLASSAAPVGRTTRLEAEPWHIRRVRPPRGSNRRCPATRTRAPASGSKSRPPRRPTKPCAGERSRHRGPRAADHASRLRARDDASDGAPVLTGLVACNEAMVRRDRAPPPSR